MSLSDRVNWASLTVKVVIEILLGGTLYVGLLPACLIVGLFVFPRGTLNLRLQAISVVLHGHSTVPFLARFVCEVVKFDEFSHRLIA